MSYYLEVAELLLPYLYGRCLTAVRYPRGVEAGGFYIKSAPKDRPEWVKTLAGDRPGTSVRELGLGGGVSARAIRLDLLQCGKALE